MSKLPMAINTSIPDQNNVISIDINGYYIRIIPTKKYISVNIESALQINWNVIDGILGASMHWDGNNLRGYYTFTQLQFMCKKTNVQIPDILYQYINQQQITHDDLKGKKIMDSKLTHNQNQTFHSELFGDLTVLTLADNELWFIGMEVAEKLGYEDPSKMYFRIDDEDKQTVNVKDFASAITAVANSKARTMILINESGLYTAVLGSKKSEAKEFKRWVTKDVIPSIRKTGSYGQQQQVKLPNMKELAIMLIQSEEEK